MAANTDPEMATKAPESDAQEDAPAEPIATTTTSSGGEQTAGSPKMGEHCITDRPVRMLLLASLSS